MVVNPVGDPVPVLALAGDELADGLVDRGHKSPHPLTGARMANATDL